MFVTKEINKNDRKKEGKLKKGCILIKNDQKFKFFFNHFEQNKHLKNICKFKRFHYKSK